MLPPPSSSISKCFTNLAQSFPLTAPPIKAHKYQGLKPATAMYNCTWWVAQGRKRQRWRGSRSRWVSRPWTLSSIQSSTSLPWNGSTLGKSPALQIWGHSVEKVYPPNQYINDDDFFKPNMYIYFAYIKSLATTKC